MNTRDHYKEVFRAERSASNGKRTDMTISSKVPSKWRFVDLETGEVWKYEPRNDLQFSKSTLKDILDHLLAK